MAISLVRLPIHTTVIIGHKYYEYFEDRVGTDILVYKKKSDGSFTFLRRVYIPKKG